MKQTQARVLGRLLAEARKQKQLSLRDVQEATGIPFTWIARTEQGHYTRPAPERLTRLADKLYLARKYVRGCGSWPAISPLVASSITRASTPSNSASRVSRSGAGRV